MSDHNGLRDDIAFMRDLAEQGRNSPVIGGAIMMTGGLLFGGASLILYIGLSTGMGMNSNIQLVWPASAVLFFIALFLMLRRMRPNRGAARGVGLGWSATGWTIFTIVGCLAVMANRLNDANMAGAIAPVILALYGCSWFIAAGAIRRPWLIWVTIGSFLMAVVTAWFAMQPVDYLIYALSLFALVATPGFVLTREARKAA